MHMAICQLLFVMATKCLWLQTNFQISYSLSFSFVPKMAGLRAASFMGQKENVDQLFPAHSPHGLREIVCMPANQMTA